MLATEHDSMEHKNRTESKTLITTMLATEHDSMEHKNRTESKTDSSKDDNHNAGHGA